MKVIINPEWPGIEGNAHGVLVIDPPERPYESKSIWMWFQGLELPPEKSKPKYDGRQEQAES